MLQDYHVINECSCGSGFPQDQCDCEEYLVQDIEDWDDYDDTVCCWHPHYQGEKGSCHCREYQEAMDRQEHWFYSRLDRIRLWWKYFDTSIYKKRIFRKLKGWKPLDKDQKKSCEDLPF